jgi:hypothetical protein
MPNFESYYRTILTKTARYWHKNRHTDQKNRIKGPETIPHSYSHGILDKDATSILEKRQFSGKTDIHV